jgi:branched-chain amino acid aminotransferase
MSPRVKSTANYMNSRLALMQARDAGYDDALLLDTQGKVTEGPGYNFFAVRDGQLITPPLTQGILEGITRDTLIRLSAEKLERAAVERPIDKTELYLCDEAFFCGSGKEVKPIRSVDGIPLGLEPPGPVTQSLRDAYFALARGEESSHAEWLTPVYSPSQ